MQGALILFVSEISWETIEYKVLRLDQGSSQQPTSTASPIVWGVTTRCGVPDFIRIICCYKFQHGEHLGLRALALIRRCVVWMIYISRIRTGQSGECALDHWLPDGSFLVLSEVEGEATETQQPALDLQPFLRWPNCEKCWHWFERRVTVSTLEIKDETFSLLGRESFTKVTMTVSVRHKE